MKTPIKKTCSFLILTIAFALTLAMAGDVLASPCLHFDVYDDPDGTTRIICRGIEVPYYGTPVGADGTEVLLNGRLWFGTDSPTPNSKGWNWLLNDDYKAVLVGGLINTGATGLGGVRLVFLDNAHYAGLNNSGTLEVLDPITNTAFPTTPFATSGDGITDPFVVYTDVLIPSMQTGVFYPFKVEYTHFSGTLDGFDFRFIDGGAVESFPEPICPPPPPVPEPATMLLLGSGLIGLAGFARRRFKK